MFLLDFLTICRRGLLYQWKGLLTRNRLHTFSWLSLDSCAQETLVCKMERSSMKKRLCDIDFLKSLQKD